MSADSLTFACLALPNHLPQDFIQTKVVNGVRHLLRPHLPNRLVDRVHISIQAGGQPSLPLQAVGGTALGGAGQVVQSVSEQICVMEISVLVYGKQKAVSQNEY